MLRRIYCKIPAYGQLVRRIGSKTQGWYKSSENVTYYSLMLRGAKRRGWFKSNTFYLVFTDHCLEEAIKRGSVNSKYGKAVPFGDYTGIQHIEDAGRFKMDYDCIFLHVFRYRRGGKIEEMTIAMSERQFKRSVVRAKNHPELVAKKRFWHGFFTKLYRGLVRFSES